MGMWPASRGLNSEHVMKRISFKGVAIGNIVDIVSTNAVSVCDEARRRLRVANLHQPPAIARLCTWFQVYVTSVQAVDSKLI